MGGTPGEPHWLSNHTSEMEKYPKIQIKRAKRLILTYLVCFSWEDEAKALLPHPLPGLVESVTVTVTETVDYELQYDAKRNIAIMIL